MKKIYNVGNRIMNTYVYHTMSGYVMVDTGYEYSLASVEKKLRRNGISLSEVRYIFLTHAHDDHAGFLNELLHKYVNIQVIMSNKAMSTLKRGQNSFDGGCSTFLAWVFCRFMCVFGKAEHRFPPIEDKFDKRFIEINDKNQAKIENLLQGKIIFTPGHTKDSISLKRDNMIFVGDAAMNGFPSWKRLTIWIENKEEFEQSWEKLYEEDVEWIYPAHGKIFNKKDLRKYKGNIKNIHLRPLKETVKVFL